MLKALGWILKTSLFALLVLVLGNWIRWDGETISDQVKSRMAFAERGTEALQKSKKSVENSVEKTVKQVKSWGSRISTGASNSGSNGKRRTPERAEEKSPRSAEQNDEISSSERQKLRSLIQELNSNSVSQR